MNHYTTKEEAVYLSIPTSNHNYIDFEDTRHALYIYLFLHQTTTSGASANNEEGCISIYSYIKPQLSPTGEPPLDAVYLSIPTSNHNLTSTLNNIQSLYIYLFLHQTTTLLMHY